MSAGHLRHTYDLKEVQRLLKMPGAAVRALIKAGIITPLRGPRRQLQFSFRDLTVMRSARALLKSKIQPRRISQSLGALRRANATHQATLAALGDRVVVREGDVHWQADDGQLLLVLEVAPTGAPERASLLDLSAGRVQPSEEEDWWTAAIAAEEDNPDIALRAYAHAVKLKPDLAELWINWGRLLHAQGDVVNAERVYREGLDRCEPHAWLHFNLAIALEDQLRTTEAIDAYLMAIRQDEHFADAHFNLARLYHARADRRQAIRHLARYRSLTRGQQ